MKPTWVFERDVFETKCFDKMVQHCIDNDIKYHVIRVAPFVHEIEGKVPSIEGPCVVYGSIGIQKVADRHDWKPGVFTDPDTFNYETYRDSLGDLILNPDAIKMKISEARVYLSSLGDKEIFIKPNGDTKEFAGTVMGAESFSSWYDNMLKTGYLDDNDFDVVISDKKVLGCEWRIAVVDGKIVDSSLYRQYQRVMPENHILPEIEELVMKAHSIFSPAPVYIVDVCQVADEFKIIEYNTLNSAGLYAMDPGKIIDAINNFVDLQTN